MQKGQINVQADNIFPIIKQFLYSDQEIFLRELVSNAVDATQKIKTLASVGEYNQELGDLTIKISVDKKKKTITISDNGVGMTEEEVMKYINEIAFSSAEEFLEKYKDKADAIIGHFGLGFYSAFMVAEKVEIVTQSYKDAPAVKWSCTGTPEYNLEQAERKNRGTDIILHIAKDSEEYLEETKLNELLNKYSKFLPVPIQFGEQDEYDDKGEKTGEKKPVIINQTEPLWTKAPANLKDEDYKAFYRDLYPMGEDPMFWIHLNVDYPFNLTGILYFPKIKNNIEIQKNKIQLYSNQVFVTDSVENIVPEFLTLLHGVIDSPDIPLNVSRSYLQSDSNVKKISNHIMKKVADKLEDIYKNSREEFEKKWDNIKLFIQYGMLSEEKFYDRAKKFALLKNIDGKYFTFDEYNNHVKNEQTDKDKKVVYLYTSDKNEQYTYIAAAKDRGYDVLELDGQLDSHFVNHIETKLENVSFARVDANTIDKLIQKTDNIPSKLSDEQKKDLTPVIETHIDTSKFTVVFESLSETDNPMLITKPEFMRRMHDMSKLGGGYMGMGQMPEMYNLVVNANHKLILDTAEKLETEVGKDVKSINKELKKLNEKLSELRKDEKKQEENKAEIEALEKEISENDTKRKEMLTNFGKNYSLVKQLSDLALLSQNMLTGNALSDFIKRSVDLIKAE